MSDEMPKEIWAYPERHKGKIMPYTGTWCYFDDSCKKSGDTATHYVRADTRAKPDNSEALSQTIESQKQTHDALIKKLKQRDAAINDMVQVIDNLRNFIGRNYIAKAMPKEQEQAYDVLQKHSETIKKALQGE